MKKNAMFRYSNYICKQKPIQRTVLIVSNSWEKCYLIIQTWQHLVQPTVSVPPQDLPPVSDFIYNQLNWREELTLV